MKKTRIISIVLAAIVLPAALAATTYAIASGSFDSPSEEIRLTQGEIASPRPRPSASPGGDISGPCDEAEHANDPRCTGAGDDRDDDDGRFDDDHDDDGDISGPCDEAEHANDPRCTGAGDDRHGDNSGPGSGDDSDDNSGPGSGDDSDDDNSGSGSDNSGSGSDDSGDDD
jgi:hypothetical protein